MRNIIFHHLKTLAIGVAVLALGACAGMPMQGYTGPALPTDRTAVVRTGPYTDIVAYDSMKLPSLSVALLPGEHTLEMLPNDPPNTDGYSGAYYFYSKVTGSVAFMAEAGHRYQAYVSIAPEPGTTEGSDSGYKDSGFAWRGYIQDETTHKRVASTGRLPIEAEPKIYPGGTGGAAIR